MFIDCISLPARSHDKNVATSSSTLTRKSTKRLRSDSSSSGSSPFIPPATLALPSARSGADTQRCCTMVNTGLGSSCAWSVATAGAFVPLSGPADPLSEAGDALEPSPVEATLAPAVCSASGVFARPGLFGVDPRFLRRSTEAFLRAIAIALAISKATSCAFRQSLFLSK